MAHTRTITSVFADAQRRIGSKVPTRRGPAGVDRAAHGNTDLARQRRTARRRRIAAAHAHQGRGEGQCEVKGDAPRCRKLAFGMVKVHPEGGASRATARAVIIRLRRNHWKRRHHRLAHRNTS